MKTKAMFALAVLFLTAFAAADALAQQVFISNLSGRQMVPAVATERSFVIKATVQMSPTTGQAELELNAVSGSDFPAGSTLSMHHAWVGTNAPALFDLPLPSGHG